MESQGITELAEYSKKLTDTMGVFDDLAGRLVVPETWFFRGSLFMSLPALVRSKPAVPFRILSIPCSTGEEPYSVAMALADAGIEPEKCSIDAADLSASAVTTARHGVYREFSFRQTTPEVRARYFQKAGDDWELSPTIRSRVRFHVSNLLNAGTLPAGLYDLVICRNLFIYLTPEARRRSLDVLEGLLTPEGFLAVGPADASVLADRSFTSVGADGDFLFRRGRNMSATPTVMVAPLPPRRTTVPPKINVKMPVSPPVVATWQAIRQLADSGRLNEACAECRRLLATSGHDAEGYALLGVIEQARGNLDAADDAFRRALYLDPNHTEALTHGALLYEQRGQGDRAASLRERLNRLAVAGGNS
ncbi:MAG: hypothetical protein K1X57_07370 [Gemmataceae bacterium]|nr:hypothetical protein [Gemmataceae bacterium]